jgi:RNA polymerase sigma-70 factor (ECF subfamily)
LSIRGDFEVDGGDLNCSPASRKEEFIELITNHWRQLFNLIFCVVQNFSDTEDLFQQTTMALWADFDKFQPGTDFGAWASKVARYRISTFLRSKHRQRVYFSEDLIKEIASVPLESNEVHNARLAALADCRKKLSSADQELIALCYGGSDSIRDAAYRIGRPADSVYVRLSKIRSALYGCIERYLAREEYQ